MENQFIKDFFFHLKNRFFNSIAFQFLGDRLIGRNSASITLDAKTLTIDPDGTKHELSCSWSCAVQGGGLCNPTVNNELIFSAVNGCIIAVQSKHFFAGKTYIIRFVPE